MEQTQETNRKLLAFTAAVLLFAGLPHFLLDRRPSYGSVKLPDRASEALLPPVIGKFQVVDRWKHRVKNSLTGGVTELGALYRHSTGQQTAQFDILMNDFWAHNGLNCYVSHGIPLQSRHTEEVQAADSMATFDVAFVTDLSLRGIDRSVLIVASTECGTKGCVQPMVELKRNEPHVIWQTISPIPPGGTQVPLSITFESLSRTGEVQDRDKALLQFRELVSNFNLLPVRNLYPTN